MERTAQLFNAHLLAERDELTRFATFVRDDKRIQEYAFIITKFDTGIDELKTEYIELYGWLPTDRTLIVDNDNKVIYGEKHQDIINVVANNNSNNTHVNSFYFYGTQELELVATAPITYKGNFIGTIILSRFMNNQWLKQKREIGAGHLLIERENKILNSTFNILQSTNFSPMRNNIFINAESYKLFPINLKGAGKNIPKLWFVASEKAVLAQLNEHLNKALLQVFAGIMVIVLLGWIFSRNFSRPLAQLSRLTKEISEGSLPEVKKSRAHTEIEVLTNHFIDMIHALKKKSEQVEIAHIELQKFAITDTLTGLNNRRSFEDILSKVVTNCKKGSKEYVLCYLDLDQFKIVNDTCGHAAGDELLRQLTSLLDSRVRGTDVLARLGGDEFGLILSGIDEEKAISVANDIIRMVREYQFVWEEKIFEIGVSIGLIIINSNTENMAEVMKRADIACYAAKNEGRNRLHIYRESDTDTNMMSKEINWIQELQVALRDNMFELWFQPIVKSDLVETTQRIEILLRLRNKNNELIPPNAFIPAAERYHLMTQIDKWVIKNTFSFLKSVYDRNNILCSINLSGLSLTDPTLFQFVVDQLNENKLDPSLICFEITETAAIHNLANAISFVTNLKNIGCKFALDDFGSGLITFKHLKHLPVDYIKIDGSFVSNIIDNPVDEGMVEAINNIAHLMNKQTIAEYVENNEVREKLLQMGVDYIQGYLIDKPKPITVFRTKNINSVNKSAIYCINNT